MGKMSPMKLVQKISAGAELDRAKDINGKLQRSLEEALMKNISLQQVHVCCIRKLAFHKSQFCKYTVQCKLPIRTQPLIGFESYNHNHCVPILHQITAWFRHLLSVMANWLAVLFYYRLIS